MRYQAAPLPDDRTEAATSAPDKKEEEKLPFLDQSRILIETVVGPEGFEPPT
jgi:hypothetical protein